MSTIFLLSIEAQSIEQYSEFTEYREALRPDKEKVYVVNYWATWCGPCVKEMPYFEKLQDNHPEIEVVLVSIDFANQYEKRLVPFIEKKNLQSRVIHMADPKTNTWIDMVDPSWSGSIPATEIYQGDKHIFLEREFKDYKDLETTFLSFINS